MFHKIKANILLTLSAILLVTAFAPYISVGRADTPTNTICGQDKGNLVGEDVAQATFTDYLPYLLDSKSSVAHTEAKGKNIYNTLMSLGGFKFGDAQDATKPSPFDMFGFSGIEFSSYLGEWKYHAVRVCSKDRQEQGGISTDYGEFYKNRKDPQASYSERISSKDPRVTQHRRGFFSKFFTAFLDVIANIILNISKLIISLVITLIALTFKDLIGIMGLDANFTESIFTKLYNGLYVPLVVLMFVLTACYIGYYGLVKREYRQALVNGLGKTLLSFVLAAILITNIKLIKVPNQAATLVQALIVDTLSKSVVPQEDELCATSVGSKGGKFDLEKAGDYMSSVIGCKMWAEYTFKPWVKAQWGKDYKDLAKLENVNEDWVGKPTVKMNNNSIENWGLFQLSIQSGYHHPVVNVYSPTVGGIDKDWYRIVDAVSNYKEKERKDSGGANIAPLGIIGDGSYGGSSNGEVGNGSGVTLTEGDWLDQNTEKGKFAKEIYDYLTTEKGLSSAAAIGILANIEAESSFNAVAIEAGSQNGFGLVQFSDNADGSPGTKAKFLKWLDGRTPDWKLQLDFIFESEFKTRDVESYFRDNPSVYGLETNIRTVEDFYNTTDPIDATKAFMIGYERPNNSPDINHIYSRRLPNTEAAKQVFLENDKKGDISKLGVSSSSSSGSSSRSGGGIPADWDDSDRRLKGTHTIYEQDVTDPLPEWDYWVGNFAGERVGYALLSLVLAILGTIAPLVFAVLSASYTIGITLLTIVAPIFLLLGCWGGRGSSILTQYLGTILVTMAKKVMASFMLVISIIISSSIMGMISDLGVVTSVMFLLIVSFTLIKNREKLLGMVASINVGQMNFSGFKQGVKRAFGAPTKLASNAVVAGATTKRNGGSFLQGAKVGAGSVVRNQLYRTETGRRAIAHVNSVKGNNSFKNEYKFCMTCGTKIKEGDIAFIDEAGNYHCENCAALQNFNNMTEIHTPPKDDETIDFTPIGTDASNFKRTTEGDLIYTGASQPNYYHTRNVMYRKDGSLNEEGVQSLVRNSMESYTKDMLRLKAKMAETGRPVKFNSLVLPDTIREYVNAHQLSKFLENNDYASFQNEIQQGWKNWYFATHNTGDKQKELEATEQWKEIEAKIQKRNQEILEEEEKKKS